jgi:hypothetical protein
MAKMGVAMWCSRSEGEEHLVLGPRHLRHGHEVLRVSGLLDRRRSGVSLHAHPHAAWQDSRPVTRVHRGGSRGVSRTTGTRILRSTPQDAGSGSA